MNRLPKAIEELNEPSEYLQDVLETPPRWIVRWGEVFVLSMVVLLVLLSWLIRYPDRIPAKLVITTLQPPIPMVARANGPVSKLWVSDQDTVGANTVLAMIENPAQYTDIQKLTRELQAFNFTALIQDTFFVNPYQLGELQSAYTHLQEITREYQLYIQITPHVQQRQAVSNQLYKYQELLVRQQRQLNLLNRKVQLAQKDFTRNQQLHRDQTIADKAIEESEQRWISTKENYERLQSELAGSQIQVANLEREWQELDTKHTLEEVQLRTTLLTALDNLRSNLAQWKSHYLLTAPQGGVISFTDFLTKQKFVSQGEEVLNVLPIFDDSLSIVGQLKVPVQNSGKLAIGQRVDVYLENYPEAEFGVLSGVVHRISALPKQGKYRVTITFPNGLTTQYSYHIPFQQHLQGNAEIITEDLRLLERLVHQLRMVTSNSQRIR